MSKIKNSVNDAMKIMRDRADASQASSDIVSNRQKRARIQSIATAVGLLAGVTIGAAATAYALLNASKTENRED